MFDNKHNRRHLTLAALLVLACAHGAAWADQYEDAAKKWIGSEFKPSTLTLNSNWLNCSGSSRPPSRSVA